MLHTLRVHELMSRSCVGCGLCVGVCPYSSVSITVRPGVITVHFDHSRCTGCMLCSRVCPAIDNIIADVKSMIETFVKSIRDIKGVFFGWSKDNRLRYEAASGGIVTSLLKFMLEHKIVDYVVVTTQRRFLALPRITDNLSIVFEARGSIYFKTFTCRIIKRVLNLLNKGYRIAFVGLPCMIRGVKKLIPSSMLDRIVFISLMCYHINELWYLKYIFWKYSPSKGSRPVTIEPRRRGWPGSITLRYEIGNGKIVAVRVAQFDLWNIVPIFELTAPVGCLFCMDHLGVEADLVVADAWHPKYYGRDNLGVSLILVRTQRGLRIIEEAAKNNCIEVVKGSLGDLIIAHKWNFILRPLQTLARKLLLYDKVRAFVKLLIYAPRLLFFEIVRLLTFKILSLVPCNYRLAITCILEKLLTLGKMSILYNRILQIYVRYPGKTLNILRATLMGSFNVYA